MKKGNYTVVINDLDLKNWKQYQNDLTTDALWVSSPTDKFHIPDRGLLNDQNFHGLYIHEIPYQMMKRYTKEDETVWDCFGGSGTTLEVCKMLKRKCIINDLNPTKPEIAKGDSKTFNPEQNVQMVIMHPPYWKIVEYSENKEDLSSAATLSKFYNDFQAIVNNVDQYLDEQRFLILVCGHLYHDGEDIPLGYHCMEIIRKFGYKCKGIIVKDYGETKGGHKKRANLEYFRALKNGYWKFQGDNIFVLQKNKIGKK